MDSGLCLFVTHHIDSGWTSRDALDLGRDHQWIYSARGAGTTIVFNTRFTSENRNPNPAMAVTFRLGDRRAYALDGSTGNS